METNKICKYCKLELQVCVSEGLSCIVCSESIHLECLEKGAVPGELHGDVFYTFTCKECSPINEEVFVRDKLYWLQVVALTLYILLTKKYYAANRGYFHWKNHIVCFIEEHWDIFFISNKIHQLNVKHVPATAKNIRRIMKAVAKTLSKFDNIFFQSGKKVHADPTVWTLKYPKLTPSAVWNIYLIFFKIKQKSKQERPSMTDRELLRSILQENIQDKSLLVTIDDEFRHLTDKDFKISAQESSTISERKRESTETVSSSPKLFESHSIEVDSLSGPSTSYKPLSHPVSASKSATIPKRKRRNIGMLSSSSSKLLKSYSKEDDLLGNPSTNYNPASASNSSTISELEENNTEIMSLSSPELLEPCSNENDLLGDPSESFEPGSCLIIDCLLSDNSSDASSTYGSTLLLPSAKPTSAEFLDPFYHFNTCVSSISKARRIELRTKLMGGYRMGLIESPYSGIFLKPYIWRDTETFPPWLQLMCQVKLKSNQRIKDYVIPPRASIDYAYVQPEHIPAVNSLCNRFFWLGIDLTESLRYPEFSCVVLYKRLIVAFAFIIPNVSHTEHYLSYIFTRPGWRRVGIAKRMLYFLIKNSAGKDITLHVSLDNVAYSMYHKFGFKVERIERNFYEKYIRTYEESKDALFCRRERSHSGDI